jgi:hypothetical protein
MRVCQEHSRSGMILEECSRMQKYSAREQSEGAFNDDL